MVISTCPQLEILASPTEDAPISRCCSTFGQKEDMRVIGPWSHVVLSEGDNRHMYHIVNCTHGGKNRSCRTRIEETLGDGALVFLHLGSSLQARQ